MAKNKMAIISAVIVAIFFLLILPKLALLKFSISYLSVNMQVSDLPFLILQDLSLAILTISCIVHGIRKQGATLNIGLVSTIMLSTFLWFDVRVRQLWLSQIDLNLIAYFISNYDSLKDGADFFFKGKTLYDLTFRRILLFNSAACVVLCIALKAINFKKYSHVEIKDKSTLSIAGFSLGVLLLVFQILLSAKYPYRLEANPIVGIIGSAAGKLFDEKFEHPKVEDLLKEFRRDVADDLKSDLKIEPFDSVIIVIYESVRWKNIAPSNDNNKISPVITKMALEGVLIKGYASVPHSSKGYHAIFTSTYPSPGVEIIEANQRQFFTILREMNFGGLIKTIAISNLPLHFENMRGQLFSVGFKEVIERSELKTENSIKTMEGTSFGDSDEGLYQDAIAKIKESAPAGKFVAAIFPTAAHFPYECGSGRNNVSYYDKYLTCLSHSDKLLGELRAIVRNDPYFSNTLVVVVGDHGESFGERGLFVHNSSLYEEEITVPLLFWSSDMRLQSLQWPLRARQIDIFPTISDLMNFFPENSYVQGRSLIRGEDSANFKVFLGTFYDNLKLGLIENNQKYLLDVSSDMLITTNLETDPHETKYSSVVESEGHSIKSRIKGFPPAQRHIIKQLGNR